MSESNSIRLSSLPGIPSIQPGDDLAALIDASARSAQLSLAGGVLAVCQKVISKAEGRVVCLTDVTPSEQARRLAKELDKDPRHVELVLSETKRIVRQGPEVLICETHQGFVCANAGVDLSNAPTSPSGAPVAVLLPKDCDASARGLKRGLEKLGHGPLAVIITDTFGRPWREGLVDIALGAAGISVIVDWRGEQDLSGRTLQVTAMALVDQLAAAAGLLMGKDAGNPVVWIEGPSLAQQIITSPDEPSGIAQLIRPADKDLFR